MPYSRSWDSFHYFFVRKRVTCLNLPVLKIGSTVRGVGVALYEVDDDSFPDDVVLNMNISSNHDMYITKICYKLIERKTSLLDNSAVKFK